MAEDHDHTSSSSLGGEGEVSLPDDVTGLVERLNCVAARVEETERGCADTDAALIREAASLITTQAQRIEELTAERDEARSIARRVPEIEFDLNAARVTLEITEGQLEWSQGRLQASEARATRAEGERDDWKRLAEHHFGHMRAALDLSYALKYLFDPEFLERVAEAITCGDDCENAWREHDTNATGCSKQDTEGCPFDDACQLRDMAKAVRVQAWTLAFSPAAQARIISLEAEVKRKDEALRPFAEMCEAFADSPDLALVLSEQDFPEEQRFERDTLHVAAFREARAALQPQEGKS